MIALIEIAAIPAPQSIVADLVDAVRFVLESNARPDAMQQLADAYKPFDPRPQAEPSAALDIPF